MPVLLRDRARAGVQLYRFAQMEGRWPSLSGLDRRVCALFFQWSIWTVFLVRSPPRKREVLITSNGGQAFTALNYERQACYACAY